MKWDNKYITWLYRQAKDEQTKKYIQELEKRLKLIKDKNKFTIISLKQKYPLKLGKWKIWFNEENSFYSMKTYVEIFKEKDHNKLSKFLSGKDLTIIDLGANEGFYTLKAKEMSPKAKIIAVEPNPSAFKILRRNIETNKLNNVILLNKAVTSKNRKIPFEIVKGQTSIGGLKVYKKYRKRGELKKIIVDSITLERLCKAHKVKQIDLLKMDVEGSELDIVRSSRNILNNVKKAVIEYHRAQKTEKPVKHIMLQNDFRIVLIDRNKNYGDMYFLKTL